MKRDSDDFGQRRGSDRRLAAVWFADIVGFTELSARDEDAAMELVEIFQVVARKAVQERGRGGASGTGGAPRLRESGHRRGSACPTANWSFVGFVYGRLDHQREALDVARRLEAMGDQTSYDVAVTHIGLGDTERASRMVYLNVDPRLDDLRSDPRFQALLHRMRLDEAPPVSIR